MLCLFLLIAWLGSPWVSWACISRSDPNGWFWFVMVEHGRVSVMHLTSPPAARVDGAAAAFGRPNTTDLKYMPRYFARPRGFGLEIPLWMPLLLLAAPTAWLWYRARPRPAHLCPECHYDLSGCTDTGCPECGWGREGKATSPEG